MPERGTERLRLEASLFIILALNFNVSLEPYLSKVELKKDVKVGEIYSTVIRQGLLRAAVETLQVVHLP